MKHLKICIHDGIKISDAMRLSAKSEEKVRERNKPIKEIEQYVDNERSYIITKERTKDETRVYHEGTRTKNGKLIKHNKHLRSIKKHNK